ncbi:type IV pilus assembly protein PilW [Deinobacterium chartae]|uniref:Type IV pilus assembly protein PilW n=2 Tax=Deinobacterium chartae TaxID=521158 RepID=A0A841HZX6_9DEIO|nr:type IV pilus assembly protein PilW [Deinobacterium chartae]
MLIAIAIGGVVITLALTATMSSRRLYQLDSARTGLNQNLRTGMSMMVNDVRQAGERLNNELPAVQIIKQAGKPDQLIIRRSIMDITLPVCKPLKSGSNTDVIFVSVKGNSSSNPNCKEEGVDKRIEEWKNYRLSQPGQSVRVYIYQPPYSVGSVQYPAYGEFFTYDAEDRSGLHLHKSSGHWKNNYDDDRQPILYIMEERKYTLNPTTKRLTLEENEGAPQDIVANVNDFKVFAYKRTVDSNVVQKITTSFGANAGDKWKDLAYVEITLAGQDSRSGQRVNRTMTEIAVPRNILSK